MEDIIPLNGRIAIVDNSVEQALPLMGVLSRHNIPYVFYKGDDVKFLPENPGNDIRILFLDLNLISERIEKEKNIRSVLYSVIKRIISPHNYPYVLVLWSRQESEYGNVLRELFLNELKSCSPIVVANYIKSDFFPNFSQDLDESVNDEKILMELKRILSSLPAYSYLMQWENHIHYSADETIQNIFHDFHSKENWENNANCILDMFANSYLEQHYDNSSQKEKVRASLLFLNEIYNDTLESNVSVSDYPNAVEFSYSVDEESKKDLAAKINECILISSQYDFFIQPGCILPIDLTEENKSYFHKLFNECFNKRDLPNKEAKLLKKHIYDSLRPCMVVVTPACDYAQKKVKYDRLIQGVIIDANFKSYVNSQSEAFYVSPIFKYEERKCVLILNFRYFITDKMEQVMKPLFRIRTSILAEIQSKLARHISRQGVMKL